MYVPRESLLALKRGDELLFWDTADALGQPSSSMLPTTSQGAAWKKSTCTGGMKSRMKALTTCNDYSFIRFMTTLHYDWDRVPYYPVWVRMTHTRTSTASYVHSTTSYVRTIPIRYVNNHRRLAYDKIYDRILITKVQFRIGMNDTRARLLFSIRDVAISWEWTSSLRFSW